MVWAWWRSLRGQFWGVRLFQKVWGPLYLDMRPPQDVGTPTKAALGFSSRQQGPSIHAVPPVPLRLLRPLLHRPHLPPPLLLAAAGNGGHQDPPSAHPGPQPPPQNPSLPPQNPDIVLVHYLNVPAMEECGCPCAPPLCSPLLCAGAPPICAATADPREWLKWSQEELVAQLRPMCEWGLSQSLFQRDFTLWKVHGEKWG